MDRKVDDFFEGQIVYTVKNPSDKPYCSYVYESHTIKSVSHENHCITLDSGTKVTITGINGRTNIALYEYDPHFGSLDMYSIV